MLRPDDLLRSAQDTLFSNARLGAGAFVIWDTSREHPLAPHLSERPDDLVVKLNHPDFKAHPRFAPILVQLTGPHDPLLDASVTLAYTQISDPLSRDRQIGGWIFDRREPAALAKHLSSRLSVYHPEGRARLRFHDPRVLAQLEKILSPEQMTWLAGGADGWWYLDEGVRLRKLPCPQLRDVPTKLRVDEAQWRALQCSATVNEVVRVLRMMGAAYHQAWLEQAHELVEQARSLGHIEAEDQVAYAVHALHVHPHFDTHPDVRRALEEARERKAGFCVAVAGFSESALTRIAQDLSGSPQDNRKGLRAR